METGVVVVGKNVYVTRLVDRAVEPVTEHINVLGPVEGSRYISTTGNIVPKFELFSIHRVTVKVEPAGIVPFTLGTPGTVLHDSMRY
jgi:hypothetical protein